MNLYQREKPFFCFLSLCVKGRFECLTIGLKADCSTIVLLGYNHQRKKLDICCVLIFYKACSGLVPKMSIKLCTLEYKILQIFGFIWEE